MSKRKTRIMMNKIKTKQKLDAKRSAKLMMDLDAMGTALSQDDYYSRDHLSYDELNDLLNLPQRYSGEL